jgi:S-adenosylmethionine:tRNA ribosyltransferase-isomerase
VPLATRLFDYDLPPELVAQAPAVRRDASRLLVVDRGAHSVSHHGFTDLPRFLRAGDLLFRNNAAVLPARLEGLRPSGGRVECFLLAPQADDRHWQCLLRPGRKLPAGARFAAPDGAFAAQIVNWSEDGTALVRFTTPAGEPMLQVAHRIGSIPLPPYILRPDSSRREEDRLRYQTVYAEAARAVAVAAPTAGLHFTPDLLGALERQGVRTFDLTLHVGLGTFRPVASETIEAHVIHRERYEIPPAAQRALQAPRSGRRVAVGTTSVRSIEDYLALGLPAQERPHLAEASVFIYPPRTFRGVDALITNFHQPRSTLLCLVAAFLAPGDTSGIDWVREIYAEAIREHYRFLSYGDAMLIL